MTHVEIRKLVVAVLVDLLESNNSAETRLDAIRLLIEINSLRG